MKKVFQWAAYIVIATVACLAFLVIIGEDDPYNPMSLTRFLVTKLAAAAVMALDLWAGYHLNKNGLFPDWVNRQLEELDDEI